MENMRNIWKPELYRIQLEAPKPKKIICNDCPDRPVYFGQEYHGIIGHKEATTMLDGEPNGAFLIRKGNESNDFYTLSWRFNNKVHHYKLFYDGSYFIKEKKYDSIYDLVADGLIYTHMELKAKHILEMINAKANYTESPYVTLNKRKLRSLSQNAQINECKTDNNTNSKENNINFIPKKDLFADLTPSLESNPFWTKQVQNHSFKVHTFKGLNWCELCANFLWGFTAQGVKCEGCGFVAHTKCSERVPNDCLPDLKKLRGVFGIDLTTLLNAHSAPLPFVVQMCVSEIEARGMDSEGIYRVSGFADEIEALKMAFDKDGPAADLSVYSNINVVAGTLKLYLRLLPVPLVTYDAHPYLVRAAQCKSVEEQVSMLRECLQILPPAHYNCLQYMVMHLYRVSLQAEANKMSAHNLSTVFAPTLVATPPAATHLAAEILSLQALIQHCHLIYNV